MTMGKRRVNFIAAYPEHPMAATKFHANYDELAQIAQRFGREAEAAQRMVGSLRSALQTLESGDWQGQGAQAFYTEMNSAVLPSLNRMVKALASAQRVTGQVCREVKAGEDAAAAMLRATGAVSGDAGNPSVAATSESSRDEAGGSMGGLLFDAALSFAPIVGDGIDLLRQGFNAMTGQPVDNAVVALSVGGLLADLGWLDGPAPDPADGANALLAMGKAIVRRVPPGPARDAIVETLERAVRNPDEVARLIGVFGKLAEHTDIVQALARYPQGAGVLLKNGPEMIEFLAKNGDNAGPVFADGRKFAEHVFKHANGFDYANAQEYLTNARKLVAGDSGVLRHTRANGDRLFYSNATNEFAVLTRDGTLRTYYKPVDDGTYWLSQTQ